MAIQTPPEFIAWLDDVLARLGMSDHEFSQVAKVGHSVISRARAGTGPGYEACTKMATAAGVAPEMVMRLAGLLPQPPEWTPGADEMASLFGQMSEGDQSEILGLARIKVERQRGERAKRKARAG